MSESTTAPHANAGERPQLSKLSGASLEACLPHRGAMLFVRNVQVLSSSHFEGTASWPAGAPVLEGHFPDRPVVPGVLLVEGAAQVAGAALNAIEPAAGVQGVLAMIRRCLFRATVFPDQTVHYRLAIEHATGHLVAVGGTAWRGDEPVAELSFALARVQDHVLAQGAGA